MKIQNKILLGVIILALLGIIILFQKNNQRDDQIRIGVILPLTGKSAAWAENTKAGIDLAYNELNDDQKKRFRIIYEDDQMDNAKSVSAYHKLKNQDKVNAIITILAGSSNAVAPLAEEDKTIMIALTSDLNVNKGRTTIFRHFLTFDEDGTAINSEVEKRNYKKIVLFATNQQSTLGTMNATRAASGNNQKYVKTITFEPKQTDFRSDIVKIKELDPDAIGLYMLPGQGGVLARQIRESGVRASLFSMGTIDDPRELEAAQGALEGMWLSSPEGPDDALKNLYQTTYGKPSPSLFIGNAYDSAHIIFGIFANTSDTQKALNRLKSMKDFSGSMGKHLSVNQENAIRSGAIIKEIKNGMIVPLTR